MQIIIPFVTMQLVDGGFELDGFDHFTSPKRVKVHTAVWWAGEKRNTNNITHNKQRLNRQNIALIKNKCSNLNKENRRKMTGNSINSQNTSDLLG